MSFAVDLGGGRSVSEKNDDLQYVVLFVIKVLVFGLCRLSIYQTGFATGSRGKSSHSEV